MGSIGIFDIIKQNIQITVSLIAIAIIILVYYIGFVKELQLLPLILTLLIALGFLIIRMIHQEGILCRNINNMQTTIHNMQTTINDIKFHQDTKHEYHADLENPSTQEGYVKIFGRFTDEFHGYNISLQADKNLDIKVPVVHVLFPRFMDQGFKKAKYLFFINDKNSLANFESFRLLMTETNSLIQDDRIMKDKLEIKLLRRESPLFEFYRGKKENREEAILDFRESPLKVMPGLSSRVFIIYERAIMEELDKEFTRRWAEGEKVNIDNYFSENWKRDLKLEQIQ